MEAKVKPRFTNAVCLAVLDKLLEAGELAAAFVDPVDQVLYPDYMRLVNCPMDLGTVRRRLREDASYAGDRFANDVRLCFSNALFFNHPNEPVYVAASTLLGIFEHEWRKFADKPVEVPPAAAPVTPKIQLAKPNDSGKILLKISRGSKKRPALDDTAAAQQEMFLSYRSRSEALMAFSERLMAGGSLRKVSEATMPLWSVFPAEKNVPIGLSIDFEARSVISALEDTQAPSRVAKWLKTSLLQLDATSSSEYVLYRVMTLLGAEESPFVEVFLLMQSPELASNVRLWSAMCSALARSERPGRIVRVLQMLVMSSKDQFRLLLEKLKAQSEDFNVTEALDRFGKWLLVDLKPSRTDLLALTCSGYPRLRQSIGQLTLEAVSQSQDLKSYAELIRLSYGPDVSATLVTSLLLGGMADKANEVVTLLLEHDSSLNRVLVLLGECNQAAKHTDDFEPLVRKLMKLFVAAAPPDQCRSLLKPFLAASASTRQQRFANVVASAFLSDPSRSAVASALSAVVVIASVANSVSGSLMAPVVESIRTRLKQQGAPLQAILDALFSLESAHVGGWSTWRTERNELVQMLSDWSAETKALHQRIQQFRKVSLMFARMDERQEQ